MLEWGLAVRIILIEDDASALAVVANLMTHMGHEVQPFTNPRAALAGLTEQVDLVVSGVALQDLNGFDVALSVHAKLGDRLPRVLLMTGDSCEDVLTAYPPSVVIGIVHKPIRYTSLERILTLLQKTRGRCPGAFRESLCTAMQHGRNATTGPCKATGLCFTSTYALCPNYNTGCGRTLRETIAARGKTCLEPCTIRHDGQALICDAQEN